MTNERGCLGGGGGGVVVEHQQGISNNNNKNGTLHRPKFASFLNSSDPDPILHNVFQEDDDVVLHQSSPTNNVRKSSASSAATSPRNYHTTTSTASTPTTTGCNTPTSGEASPYLLSPWNNNNVINHPSPYTKSPWIAMPPPYSVDVNLASNGLIGSIVREEGHIYSLAASGDLLYTGSDSKNIRVWKDLKEFSGFKSNSGLIKAIVISNNRIFTGHQDGKIRVWRISTKNPNIHKRVGSLPTLKDFLRSSVNPKNYVEVRRKKNVLRIKHFDTVSCLSLNEEQGLLYSGSWDKTLKVWRISDLKCLESLIAHDDAINAVVSGFDSFVFTGSADGTVKVWRRELQGKRTQHFLVQVLLKQENAVTALAVNSDADVVYCGSSDGLVNFWEREKHLSHGGILRGHKMAVLCLASAGSLVFSGSADKNICVWRKEGNGVHSCLAVLTGHTGPVKCLAVTQDHESDQKTDQRWKVYSGSLDKSVKVWRVSDHAPDMRCFKSPAHSGRSIQS
ncbi:hypothetical protein Ddye_003796 [Dipteronia dyeriana]|uniref:Uncharacterized protein n=1 Tax=Dipteronia dyeriana TaxID=168575 RepID=A0AAD9XU53_9ROSI|nr:hypothetical protein Ddye_003796 [Dipteronia dyeriana]